MNARQLFSLSAIDKQALWILTDEDLRDSRWRQAWHKWFVILASSPKKVDISWQWVKDRNAGVTYINNWEWDEMYAALT